VQVKATFYQFLLIAIPLLVTSSIALAQSQPAPPSAHPSAQDYGTDCAYANFFAGPATATSGAHLTGTAGITFGQYFARRLGKGISASPQFELGIAGPIPGGHPVDGFVSADAMFANKLPHRPTYPFLTGGYTRIFATGNAVNFGLGVDLGKHDSNRLIRIELRDYYLFTGPTQHIVGLRIGFGTLIAD